MRNISTERAMAHRARWLITSGLLLILAGLVIAALGALLIVVPVSTADWYATTRTVLLVVSVLVMLFGVYRVFRGWRFPVDNPHAVEMAGYLAGLLDYRYTFIRNISGRALGYVDAVLVGPNGALVFYFLTAKGAFLSDRNAWLVRTRDKLRPAGINPTREAVKDVDALREFLSKHQIEDIPVYAIVVVARPGTTVEVQQPVVPVAYMNNVRAALADNYLARERVSAEQVQATTHAILQGLN